MRRLLPLLWIALLTVPLAATVWDPLSPPLTENRRIAPPPTPPTDWPTLIALPGETSAWLTDHFGLRGLLTVWHNRVKYALFGEYPGTDLVRGKDDQIFLNFGWGEAKRSLRALCGLSIPAPLLAERTAEIIAGIADIRAVHPKTYIWVIPDKSRVMPEKLPDWLQADCAQSRPPIPTILAEVTARLGDDGHILYPLAALRATNPYPPPNFHWTVGGTWPLARMFAETQLGLSQRTSPVLRPIDTYADISSFMPGLRRPVVDAGPDWTGTGVSVCQDRPECFPEFPDIAKVLFQASRYQPSPSAAGAERGPRLLLLSDSFGAGIAPGLAPYVTHLWHFLLNESRHLTDDQWARWRQHAITDFNPDIIVLVFSEGGLLGNPRSLASARRLLTPEP